MKRVLLTLAVSSLLMMSCKKEETKTVTTDVETDTIAPVEETTTAAPMDSAAMAKAWENYMTPGEPHKFFAKDAGTWDEEATMYMGANDPNPQKWKMTAFTKMILGGRYQESRHTGNVMGQPFEGVSVMGYDNASNKIVSTWYDNFGTGIMYLTGEYNPNSDTVELRGKMTDPLTGNEKPYRELFKIIDNDTRKIEMYDVDANGMEYKSMEITMTRKK